MQNAIEGTNKNRSPSVEPIMINMFDTTDIVIKKNKMQYANTWELCEVCLSPPCKGGWGDFIFVNRPNKE